MLSFKTAAGEIRAYLDQPKSGYAGMLGLADWSTVYLRADLPGQVSRGDVWVDLDLNKLAGGELLESDCAHWRGRALVFVDPRFPRERRVLSGEQIDQLIDWARSAGWVFKPQPFSASPRSRLSLLAERALPHLPHA